MSNTIAKSKEFVIILNVDCMLLNMNNAIQSHEYFAQILFLEHFRQFIRCIILAVLTENS